MNNKTLVFLVVFTFSACFAEGFSLDVFSEKAETVSKDILKELNWSSVKSKEELFLEYISNKEKIDTLKLFYCVKQIAQKKEEVLPDVVKVLALTDNEDRFAAIALPLVYTKDRRLVDPLQKIVEDKKKSMKMRGLAAGILATYAKSDAYAKEKWKLGKTEIYTTDFNRLEKDEVKMLLDYVDNLKFRDDIGVDMFLWIKPGIYDFVQSVELEEILKDKEKANKKEAILKDLKSDKKDKRENAIYAMLNLPFPGRDKLLEGISKTDPDAGIKKSAKLYLKVLDRVKLEKPKPVVTEEKK